MVTPSKPAAPARSPTCPCAARRRRRPTASSRCRILRLRATRLGDHHPALHATGQRHDLAVPCALPKVSSSGTFLDMRRIARLAEQAAAEAHRIPDGLERIGGELLRHQADHGAHDAVVLADIAAVHQDGALGRGHDSANDVDQGGLAGAVGTQEREDLAFADAQVDGLERLVAGGVGLRKTGDGDDGLHGGEHDAAMGGRAVAGTLIFYAILRHKSLPRLPAGPADRQALRRPVKPGQMSIPRPAGRSAQIPANP